MTYDKFLACFPQVRLTTRGAMVSCPSHDDRTPSLSVREGDDGRILIRDFGGCSAKEILLAMGLAFSDLWPDREPRLRPRRLIHKPWRYDWRRTSRDVLNHADALFLRAESVFAMAHHLRIDDWTDDELDAALCAVSRAYQDREQAERLHDVAFHVRCRGLEAEARRRAHAA